MRAFLAMTPPHILDRRWNDDNWTDYDELMSIEAPNPTEDINPVKTDPIKAILAEIDDICAAACCKLDSIRIRCNPKNFKCRREILLELGVLAMNPLLILAISAIYIAMLAAIFLFNYGAHKNDKEV